MLAWSGLELSILFSPLPFGRDARWVWGFLFGTFILIPGLYPDSSLSLHVPTSFHTILPSPFTVSTLH